MNNSTISVGTGGMAVQAEQLCEANQSDGSMTPGIALYWGRVDEKNQSKNE